MTETAHTIVAAATPPGIGGVAIIRISGANVERIARQLLGELPRPRQATYTEFRGADGEAIDVGLALYFPAPASFTGESVLELHGHGGPTVVSLLIDAVVELGARLAEPGEFTKRAFLNDKLDLTQAEAVADLIGSGTAQAARAALRSLSGAFSSAVDALAKELVQLRVHVEAAIDFPEEEIDFLADEGLLKKLDQCGAALDRLVDRASVGRMLRNGYQVVIVGKPNAGKSSLLNRLSGEDAAIVTEVAGTTRDIIREQINIDGLAVELIDTAGLRDNPDRIEAEGISRARAAMANADAVLWIQDATATDDAGEEADIPTEIPIVIIRNKIDLTKERAGVTSKEPLTINLSAKTGEGLDALREQLRELAGYKGRGEGAFTARKRHIDALRRTHAHFNAGREALSNKGAGELLAEELRLAHDALGEIAGTTSSDELLGRIFSEFCIGK